MDHVELLMVDIPLYTPEVDEYSQKATFAVIQLLLLKFNAHIYVEFVRSEHWVIRLSRRVNNKMELKVSRWVYYSIRVFVKNMWGLCKLSHYLYASPGNIVF